MNINYDLLNLKVSEDEAIVNAKEIVAYILSITLDDDAYEYMSSLLSKLKFSNYKNKNKIIDAIGEKILEYETNKMIINSNADALKLMQNYNDGLKKINIIETKKENNVSGIDIDLMTYVDRNNRMEILVCSSNNMLNDFFKKNYSAISKYKAADIIDYFVNEMNLSLEFHKVNQENTSADVYDKVIDYANKFGLSDKILVADYKGLEKFYIVGDGILKFNIVDGELNMQVLRQPMMMYSVAVSIEEEKENKNKGINSAVFKKLIDKRMFYDVDLSVEDQNLLNNYLLILINTMETRVKTSGQDSYKQELLDSYMDYLLKSYNVKNALSDSEMEICDKYIEVRNRLINVGLYKVYLESEKTLEKRPIFSSGVTTILFLLEVFVLAGFVIAFLTLD